MLGSNNQNGAGVIFIVTRSVLVLSLSHGVFSSPFSSCRLIFYFVGLVDVGNFWHERIIWVGVCQQGGDGEEDLGDGECWGPLILEDVQAN